MTFVNWKINIPSITKLFQLSWIYEFMSNVQNKSWSILRWDETGKNVVDTREKKMNIEIEERQSTLILWIYIFQHVIHLELEFLFFFLHKGIKLSRDHLSFLPRMLLFSNIKRLVLRCSILYDFSLFLISLYINLILIIQNII